MHEPRNVLSTVEREPGDDRQTVHDLVDIPQHVYPVGRLDYESKGLVLLTNDGKLTNQLTHPRYGYLQGCREAVISGIFAIVGVLVSIGIVISNLRQVFERQKKNQLSGIAI